MLEHNKIVYDEVIERLKTSSRVCIVQATGTGKGVIASSLIEDYVKVLVVAPTNAILENYRMNLGVNSENVIFYTYQGISMLLNNQIEELGEKVSLIILDEFHRIGAETWGRKVEMLCDRAESKGCKTVGLSATPVRYLDNERDMSEEFFKGNVVNGLNIVDAVVSGVLPTFKYVVSYYGYEKDLFKKLEERKEKVSNEIKQIVSNLENNYSIGKIIQKETNELSNNQKWIVFFSKIEELEEFKDKIYSWFNGKVNIFILHSQSNYSGNMKVLKEFNNSDKDINVLLSVNMLNEGVHIKDIDGVIMMRKTISPIVYLQQLGRALQIGGKNPIIFDFIGNLKRLGRYEDFRLNIIEEINSKLNTGERECKSEKKIIIESYCEEVYDVLEKIYNSLCICREWKTWELDILKKYYKIGGSKECINKGLKDRTYQSIQNKAKELGLTHVNSWSESDLEKLRKYYPIGAVKVCQENGLSNHSAKSIYHMAFRLGITNREKWTFEEYEILKKYYPIGSYSLCQENGLNRTIPSIHQMARSMNLKNPFGIQDAKEWSEEELSILIKYYPIGGYLLCQEKGLKYISKEKISYKASSLGLKVEIDKKGLYREDRWSDEETCILKEYYPIGGYLLCQEKGLGHKSKSSIYGHANALGIKMFDDNKGKYGKELWTDEEISILKEYYPIGGYRLCQKKGLNKTWNSTKYMVKKLGIIVENEKLGRYRSTDWSKEDLDILVKYYPIGCYQLCQENGLCHKSKSSIMGKARRLGLIVNKENRKKGGKNIWTEDEVNILRENYVKLGKNIVELLPNRTWYSINEKAYQIGLKTITHIYSWSEEEINILKENFSELGNNIVELLPNRTWHSIRMKAVRLGIKVK